MSSWSSSLIEMMADHSKTQQIRYGRVIVKDTNDLGDIIFIGKVIEELFAVQYCINIVSMGEVL